MTATPVRAAVRRWAALVALVVVYAVVRAVFLHAAAGDGLVTPSAGLDASRVTLGLATLGLRALVLGFVPFVVVYRAVYWLGERVAKRL